MAYAFVSGVVTGAWLVGIFADYCHGSYQRILKLKGRKRESEKIDGEWFVLVPEHEYVNETHVHRR